MENLNVLSETQQTQELEEIAQNYDELVRTQEMICKSRLFPKNIQGQKETLEKMGIKFYEYSPIEDMYSAILPEGWSLVPTKNVLWTKIVDNNEFERGLIYYNPIKGASSVSLKARYGVHTQTTEIETPNGTVVEKRVYFGDDENMLRIAGYVAANLNEENAEAILAQAELFKQIAKAYGDKYYPDYDDVTLYWGTQKSQQYHK